MNADALLTLGDRFEAKALLKICAAFVGDKMKDRYAPLPKDKVRPHLSTSTHLVSINLNSCTSPAQIVRYAELLYRMNTEPQVYKIAVDKLVDLLTSDKEFREAGLKTFPCDEV